MDIDYMIVGFGIGGAAIVNELEKNKKSFVVFDSNKMNASTIAGGIYNPIILKRFSLAWNGDEYLKKAITFYKEFEKRFKVKVNYEIPVCRIFNTVAEQNKWLEKADRPIFSKYLDATIYNNKLAGVDTPFGYGLLKNTGRIDLETLLKTYKTHLKKRTLFFEENFDYSNLKIETNKVCYRNFRASKIIFCEGFELQKNPFFNYLPLEGSKGELLTIHSKGLSEEYILKSSGMVMPLSQNQFLVGATFNKDDLGTSLTDEGRNELKIHLDKILNVPYRIISQKTGIRPTVVDRRPMIGIHPKFKNLTILNGLGTRGVTYAPKLASILIAATEFGELIPKEIEISRFS